MDPLPEQLFDVAVPDAPHTLGGVKDGDDVRLAVWSEASGLRTTTPRRDPSHGGVVVNIAR